MGRVTEDQVINGRRAPASGPPNLMADQIALGDSLNAYLLAHSIERVSNRDGRWFSASTVGAGVAMQQLIKQGEKLGLWREEPGKNYYRHTHLTWPWIRTTIARFDEKTNSPKQITPQGQS